MAARRSRRDRAWQRRPSRLQTALRSTAAAVAATLVAVLVPVLLLLVLLVRARRKWKEAVPWRARRAEVETATTTTTFTQLRAAAGLRVCACVASARETRGRDEGRRVYDARNSRKHKVPIGSKLFVFASRKSFQVVQKRERGASVVPCLRGSL